MRVWPCLLLGLLAWPAAGADRTWVEITSPHFTVISNASEKQARRVAEQFEQIRAVLGSGLKLRVDPGKPFIILALRDSDSFKALLPQFWETKNHAHPAGVFQSGPEKHYVALRLDVNGTGDEDNPYHVVYHEYVHMLIGLSYHSLPLWLNEGLAEFYGNTVIGQKEVGLGRPSWRALALLKESKPMPLESLFAVNHSSPQYNEANRVSLFYAQSWAITHYFMMGDAAAKKQYSEFTKLLRDDVPDLEAAQRAFGDLKVLDSKLRDYVQQRTFYYASMKTPADIKVETFTPRTLSPAESAVARADFLLHSGRSAAARPLLEEALRLNPNLAAAHEGMGLYFFRVDDRKEASRWFSQAVKLDSRNYLAQYFSATLAASDGPEVEAGLRRTIELNPNFAPAFSRLAGYYVGQKGRMEDALAMARKAAALEPSVLSHQLNLGHVLLSLSRFEEATKMGERLLASAKSDADREAAKRFIENIADKKHFDEEMVRVERRNKELAAQNSVQPVLVRKPDEGGRRVVDGVVGAVGCRPPATLEIDLQQTEGVVKLRAGDFHKVDYFSSTWEPPDHFDACKHLKGLAVRVTYVAPGEIQSVEIRK